MKAGGDTSRHLHQEVIMDRTDRVIANAGSSILWPDQVRALILAARKAWLRQQELGLTDDGFDDWRKAALWDAVQVGSFRLVGQRQYGKALKYFAELAGRQAPAAARREISGEGDRRRAEYILGQECSQMDAEGVFGEKGAAMAYAGSLFRQIHKTTLDAATARQVWQVIFTIRSRARGKRAKMRCAGSAAGPSAEALKAPPVKI